MIIFPADERCSGIGEHALDGISDAVEVYIPANITFVAPGVLEKIGGLMYIEVAPDEAVVDCNLITSPAWPGNTAILREFAKALGCEFIFRP